MSTNAVNGFQLQVWDPELLGMPATYEEAVAILNAPDRPVVPLESHAKVHAFLKALQEAAPDCREFLSPETRKDFKLLLKQNTDFQGIGGLLTDKAALDRFELHFFVRLANRFGLVLHSRKLTMAILPDQVVLPPEKKPGFVQLGRESDPHFPDNTKYFRQLALPRLVEMLLFHGFRVDHSQEPLLYNTALEKTEQLYSRTINGVYQRIKVNVFYNDRLTPSGRIYAEFEVRSKLVSNIYNLFAFRAFPCVFFTDLVGSSDYYPLLGSGNDWGVKDISSLERLLEGFSTTSFPMLDLCTSIKGLDAAMNGDGYLKVKERVHSAVCQPQSLIVARLAGNPNFEELAIKLKTFGRWGINKEVMETEYPKLVDYLRNHVQPL